MRGKDDTLKNIGKVATTDVNNTMAKKHKTNMENHNITSATTSNGPKSKGKKSKAKKSKSHRRIIQLLGNEKENTRVSLEYIIIVILLVGSYAIARLFPSDQNETYQTTDIPDDIPQMKDKETEFSNSIRDLEYKKYLAFEGLHEMVGIIRSMEPTNYKAYILDVNLLQLDHNSKYFVDRSQFFATLRFNKSRIPFDIENQQLLNLLYRNPDIIMDANKCQQMIEDFFTQVQYNLEQIQISNNVLVDFFVSHIKNKLFIEKYIRYEDIFKKSSADMPIVDITGNKTMKGNSSNLDDIIVKVATAYYQNGNTTKNVTHELSAAGKVKYTTPAEIKERKVKRDSCKGTINHRKDKNYSDSKNLFSNLKNDKPNRIPIAKDQKLGSDHNEQKKTDVTEKEILDYGIDMEGHSGKMKKYLKNRSAKVEKLGKMSNDILKKMKDLQEEFKKSYDSVFDK